MWCSNKVPALGHDTDDWHCSQCHNRSQTHAECKMRGISPWKAEWLSLLTLELLNHTASKSRERWGFVLFRVLLRDFSSFGAFFFPLARLFSGLVLWAVPQELISIFDVLSPTNRPLIYRTITERGASSIVEEGVEISTAKKQLNLLIN